MPFDPTQPFESVDEKPAFDPSQPHEAVAVADFDPTQPFEAVDDELTSEQVAGYGAQLQEAATGFGSPIGATARLGAGLELPPPREKPPVQEIRADPTVMGSLREGKIGQAIGAGIEGIRRKVSTDIVRLNDPRSEWTQEQRDIAKAAEERFYASGAKITMSKAKTDLTAELAAAGVPAQDAFNAPIFTFGKPEDEALAGVAQTISAVEGAITPTNAMIGSVLPGAPALVKTLAGAYFGAVMGKPALETLPEIGTNIAKGELTEAGKGLVDFGVGLGFATGAVAGVAGARPKGGRVAEMDATRMAQDFKEAAKTPVEAPTPPEPVVTATPTTEPVPAPAVKQEAAPAAGEAYADSQLRESQLPKAENRSEGPGAAATTEFQEQGKVGAYNEKVDEQRAVRGKPPLMSRGREANPETWDRAVERIEANPDSPAQLVERIHERPKDAVSRDEQAELLWRMTDLRNKLEMESERAADAKTSPEEQALAQGRAEAVERQLQRTEEADRMAGSAEGAALQFRQVLANEDYTFGGIMMRARKQKGDVLTPDERAVIRKQADEIAALQTKVTETQAAHAEATAGAARTQFLEATIAELRKTARPTYGKPILDRAEKIVARLEQKAIESDAYIRNALGRTSAGIDPALLYHVGVSLAAKIGRFGLEKTEAFARMVTEYGEAVRPYLENGWKKAHTIIGSSGGGDVRNIVKEGVSKPVKGEKKPADVRARAKAEASAKLELSDKTAYEAVRAVINSGVKGELEIMGGALDLLRESYPDLTLEKLDLAFSGYGKAKYPSTEATAVELAKLHRLRQMQSAIEDVKRRGETAKSGVQRAKADADVRKRQAKLKVAIEEFGKEVPTSPEQLANRERARLTRAENAIADLDQELRTGEARIKAQPKMPSAELEQLQSELAAMRELQKEIKDAQNPPKTEAEKQVEQLTKQRDKVDNVLSGKETPKTPKEWQALSDAAGNIKAEILAMQELAAQLRRDAKPKADPEYGKEQARIKALEDAIARYSDKTSKSDFSAPGKQHGPDTARLAALKVIRDSRRAAYEAARKAGRPVLTAEERYNATRAKSIEKQLVEAERRIRERDFGPRVKKVQPALSKENLDARAELEKVKNEVRKGEHEFRQAQRTRMKKLWDGIKQTKQAGINIISSLDLSAPRQGFIYLLTSATRAATSPGMILRPFRDMFIALSSERGAARVDQRIKARANRTSGADKASGAQFQEITNERFTPGEENAHSILDEWAKIPIKGGSLPATIARGAALAPVKAVRMSNRAFVTFLNSARAELLDHLLATNFKDRAPTQAEIRLVGDVVNLATGRGNMNPKVASALGYSGLWSPNLLISRLQLLVGQPLWSAALRGEGRAAKIVAKEYARIIASAAMLYAISRLFSEEKEKKSTSSDFTKIIRKGKGGNTRIDLWAGFQQQTVLGERFRTGRKTTIDGETQKVSGDQLGMIAFKFYRSKLRPDAQIVANIALRKDWQGKPTTPTSVAKSLIPIPISAQELLPLIKAHGLSEAAALEALQLFGAGVSNYENADARPRPR